jgi:hypothetical protein
MQKEQTISCEEISGTITRASLLLRLLDETITAHRIDPEVPFLVPPGFRMWQFRDGASIPQHRIPEGLMKDGLIRVAEDVPCDANGAIETWTLTDAGRKEAEYQRRQAGMTEVAR